MFPVVERERIAKNEVVSEVSEGSQKKTAIILITFGVIRAERNYQRVRFMEHSKAFTERDTALVVVGMRR